MKQVHVCTEKDTMIEHVSALITILSLYHAASEHYGLLFTRIHVSVACYYKAMAIVKRQNN